MFANPEVSIKHLPRADDVAWQLLHPRYVRVQQLVRSGVLAIVLMAWMIAFVISDIALVAFVVMFAAMSLVGIASILWPLIAVPRCGYSLREHDMVYRQGVITRTVTAVPFNRIQHVEVSSGPLDRRFGIGTLKLYTAGGSGGDLSVAGLPGDTAELLRDHILGKASVAVELD